jgi:hypothetical protein
MTSVCGWCNKSSTSEFHKENNDSRWNKTRVHHQAAEMSGRCQSGMSGDISPRRQPIIFLMPEPNTISQSIGRPGDT